MRNIRIAIDGTASAGKGSIARGVSKRLGISYIDTGAMYRGLAYTLTRSDIPYDDHLKIAAVLAEISFDFFWNEEQLRLVVNGQDCTDFIRTEEIGNGASIISVIPEVRKALAVIQKKYSTSSSVVMDGRDIATVIIPDAELKVFVDANIETRAKRRYAELLNKGKQTTFEVVFKELKNRDYRDSTRKIAPLKRVADARLLDTTHISIEAGIEKVYHWAQELY
jgi:cytidylate kinase